ARNGQPQPGPVSLRLRTLEPLEDALLVGRVDAGPFVRDADRGAAAESAEAETNDAAPRRMTDCVADQIDEDLDDRTLFAPGGQRTGTLRRDRHPLLLGRGI